MNHNTPIFTKLFVLLLVGLLLGTTFTVLATGKEGENADYEVTLNLGKTEETISQGETAGYGGIIKNTGKLDDVYTISFGGKDYDKEGISVDLANRDTDDVIDLDNVSMEAGQKIDVVLSITIDRDEEADYEITMMIRSQNDDEAWDAAKTITTVIQEEEKDYAFILEARETEQVTHYHVPVTYFMTLVNVGNVEDSYAIKVEYAENYINVVTTLMVLSEDGEPQTYSGEGDAGDELEVSLEAGEKLLLALEVDILDIRDNNDDDDPTGSDNEGWREHYIVRVLAESLDGPELLKMVKTVTYIKEEEPSRLVFESYESEKQIVRGGEAEYLLYLTNQGWSPVEVTIAIDPYPYSDIETQLYLIAPYWFMGYPGENGVDGQTGDGVVYDAVGNIVRFGEDDILWNDYGGLIPVDENFSYEVYPHDRVQFLLTVDHLDDSGAGGDVNITLFSQDYDVSVTVKGEGDIEETFTTTTEVVYNPIYGIEMSVREQRQVSYPNHPVEFIIELKNTGNVDEMVELTLGEDFGLFGVSAFLYVRDDWGWCDPEIGTANWGEESGEEYGLDGFRYEDDSLWNCVDPITIYQNGEKQFHNTDPIAGMMPYWEQGELQLFIEVGREIKLVLQVSIMYEEGSYNISVTGQVPEQENSTQIIRTQTVIREVEYIGFQMKAPTTRQTMVAGEYVDYQISLYNPGYYTDEIVLELGGEDLNNQSVKTELFMKQNVYYYEADYGEYLRKDNPDVYLEYGGGIYDAADMGQEAYWEKNPETGAGAEGAASGGDVEDMPEEYFLDNAGAIFKNYEYEYELWQDPAGGFDEDRWLIPLPRGEKSISLGPFEEVWLVLRITIVEEGEYAIDLSAKSEAHPEYLKVVSTETKVKEGGEAGLELFIGDPNHFTAFGITTIYVFQLTNTGELRDTVLLDVGGKDAFDPNVYVELAVKGRNPTEPVFLEDRYGATILPYNDRKADANDNYYYQQWTTDPDDMEITFPSGDPDDFQRELVDVGGQIVDMPGGAPSDMNAPLQYSFMNWDLAEGDSGNRLEGFEFQNSQEPVGDEEPAFFDLDNGFIPYHQFGEKYVELEPDQTVIVTMKVTVYDWDVNFPGWLDDLRDEDDKPGPEGETSTESPGVAKDDDDMVVEKTKENYEVVLTATSRRNPLVTARARTTTTIYDEDVQKGIENGKMSGVVNVFRRNMSQAIFEEGFEILPLALESGKIELKVRGNFSEGRLMIVNINASNMEQMGNFDVLFDQLKMKRMSPEEIVDYDGKEARYAFTENEDGAQIMAYIPHFSEHVISIQSSAVEEQDSGSGNGVALVAGMIMAVMVGIIGFGYIQRREEARKKEFRLKLNESEGFSTVQDPKTPVGDKQLESLLDESLFFDKKV